MLLDKNKHLHLFDLISTNVIFLMALYSGLTWNNLILLPGIMPLHWLIFSPGYFSCISLHMVSSTSALHLSIRHLQVSYHFLYSHIKKECATNCFATTAFVIRNLISLSSIPNIFLFYALHFQSSRNVFSQPETWFQFSWPILEYCRGFRSWRSLR